MRHPFPYQELAIDWLSARPKAILALEMGLGKTGVAIRAADQLRIRKILVICPAVAITNWQREFALWQLMDRTVAGVHNSKDRPNTDVVIVNYDKISRNSVPDLVNRKWDLIILDECFPAGTMIETSTGLVPIEAIQPGMSVLSRNPVSGKVEYRRVVRHIRRVGTKGLVRVYHEHGELTCTPDHKLFTDDGYAPAKDCVGKDLRWLRRRVLSEGAGQKDCPVLLGGLSGPSRTGVHRETLQTLRCGVLATGQRSEDREVLFTGMQCERSAGSDQKSLRALWRDVRAQEPRNGYVPVLLQGVQREVAGSHEPCVGRNLCEAPGGESWFHKGYSLECGASSEAFGRSAASVRQAGGSGETSGEIRRPGWQDLHRSTRRERDDHPPAATDPRYDGLSNGVSDRDHAGARSVHQSAELLSSGPGGAGSEVGDRDRWGDPSNPPLEVPGCQEDGNLGRSRVVRVEVLERGSGCRPGESGGGDPWVYDLEVEGNHNYFADGCLVSNCHALKTATASRTKRIYGNLTGPVGDPRQGGLVSLAQNVWCLTATPIPNHLGEIWTHIRALMPQLLPLGPNARPLNYWGFVERYCDCRETPFGMQITGNKKSTLPEVKAMLRPFVLRVKKTEVLPDLPPIRFVTTVIEASDLGSELAELERHPDIVELNKTLEAARAAVELREGHVDREERGDLLDKLANRPGHIATLRRMTSLVKVDPAIQLLTDELESGALDKVIVFAVHRETVDRLAAGLKQFGTVKLYGGTPQHWRQTAIDEFQNEPDTRVFVGQIQACGTAINLTAASDVVFVESSWVPSDNSQAASRAHRIGTKSAVLVRFLALAGSVDELVQDALARKTAAISQVLN